MYVCMYSLISCRFYKPSIVKKYSSANLNRHTIQSQQFITLIFTKIPEKSESKLPIILCIYSKDFMKCFHVELCSVSTKKFRSNNTKIIYKIIFSYHVYRAHSLQLQEEQFQFFNKVLKYVQIFVRFYMESRKLFKIFGPKLSKLLVLMDTCFFLGIFKFSLYCFLTGLEHSVSSKIYFIKLGFKLFRVLYISMQSLCFL